LANGHYEPEWCKERHDRIEKEFEAVWGRTKSIDKKVSAVDNKFEKKFDAILLGIIANLATMIGILTKLLAG